MRPSWRSPQLSLAWWVPQPEGIPVTRNLLPTATTIDERKRDARVAVLPVGSFEQHGSHLPLSTDTLIACLIAAEVANTYDLMLLPPITIGCSHEHAGWRGTISISARTLHAVITDIADSARTSGVPKLLIVNGHGGNYVLENVVQEASVNGPNMALFPMSADWHHAREVAGMEITDGWADMHAGELETSILLHALPDVVRETYTTADSEVDVPHLLTLGVRGYSASGVIGRPSAANAQKGEKALASLAARAEPYLRALIATDCDDR
jgi:creatinine amidohydrolase